MKRNKERVPGFDEIIFENRNKEYGAYNLRKRYASATFYSIVGGVSIVAFLVILLYSSSEKDGIASYDPRIITLLQGDPLLPDPNQIKQPEPEKPKNLTDRRFYGPPEIVNDTSAHATTLLPNDVLIDSIQNGTVIKDDSLIYNPDPIGNIEPEPAIFPEEMPTFPGGELALLKFITENLKYPQEAIVNNIEGKVFLKFVVSSDGSVKRIEIIKGRDPLLDAEAIRVVSILPKWKPGKQNGRPVPVWFSVPVSFQLKRN
jgi:periplasmic protein TonB